MNRDTFERFKVNEKLMNELLAVMFDEVDVTGRKTEITKEEFLKWAEENPELNAFAKDLHSQCSIGVHKAAGHD